MKDLLAGMVEKIRSSFRVPVLDATGLTTEARYAELAQVAQERQAVTQVCKALDLGSPQARYNVEFSTARELTELTGVPCSFQSTHYWFWTPLLSDLGLLGSEILSTHHQPRVLEVGAGNGAQLELLAKWFWKDRISAVDISAAAVKRIREMCFEAHHGRLEDIKLEADRYNMVFLSYFVDRDLDQQATFEECARITRPNATVVLEGLFPCVLEDSTGVSYGKANVTRGKDALEDIGLVTSKLESLDICLRMVVVGQRLVYSIDGAEVLPSYTLIFKKATG